MHRINEDKRRRILLLSERLEEIAASRNKLVTQLNGLDVEEKSIHIERITLHNLLAPISIMPDEMLAMIFQMGSLLKNSQWHFGTVASHVTRRWRRIALATTYLWTHISFLGPGASPVLETAPYLEKRTERAIAFLSRCRTSSIDVSITHVRRHHLLQEFIQLVSGHMNRCRQLCIKDVNAGALERAIQRLCNKDAPHLRSIALSAEKFSDHFNFLVPLFPFGAPQLRTAELGGFRMPTFHFCTPALRFVTSLRLTGISIGEFDDTFESFRDALMALCFLHHLELQFEYFGGTSPNFSIVLPTIKFLRLDATVASEHHNIIIRSFQAVSLTTLSLNGWNNRDPDPYDVSLELEFPSLDHLILLDIAKDPLNLDFFARRFPHIQRLTCQVDTQAWYSGVGHILTRLAPTSFGTGCEEEVGLSLIDNWERWPKLWVLAVSSPNSPLTVVDPCNVIAMLQYGKSSIRKLMLPKSLFAKTDASVLKRIKGLVELEDYSLDWPRPFV